MKHQFTITIDDNRTQLQDLLRAASAFLGGAEYQYREVVQIGTNSDQLAVVIGSIVDIRLASTPLAEHITGLEISPGEEDCELVQALAAHGLHANTVETVLVEDVSDATRQAAATAQELYSEMLDSVDAGNRCKYCGTPLANKRRIICADPECQKAYNRDYAKGYSRRKNGNGHQPEEEQAVEAPPPFPEGMEWMIQGSDTEQMAPTFLNQADLLELLENYQVTVGAILIHRDGHRRVVTERQDGLVLAEVGTGHTTPVFEVQP